MGRFANLEVAPSTLGFRPTPEASKAYGKWSPLSIEEGCR